MKYVVSDTETNILNTGDGAVGTMSGSPFSPRNSIVAFGERISKTNYMEHDANSDWNEPPAFLMMAARGIDVLLVLFNAPFDIAYFAKTWPEAWDDARPYLYLWDAQQVAYLLSGNLNMYPSLDDEAAALGLPLKDSKIKDYWDQGIDTAMIPWEELGPYLAGDLENTEAVFLDQWNKVKDNPALLNLIRIKMDDILMTTAMQIHGMKFDLQFAQKQLEGLDEKIASLTHDMVAIAAPFFIDGYEWDPASDDDVSVLLFGGHYKRKESVPVLDANGEKQFYKSGAKKGQLKTRIETVVRETDGLELRPGKTPRMKNGNFSTQEIHLKRYVDKHEFVGMLLQWREASKDASTYYRGYSQWVWPDGYLHPNRNHSSTVTGRLSCTSPNLENVTKEEEA